MDFFDILLAKKLEDDRDPTIEGLSVTENGIYSEENKAYNPVIVEVPEPTLKTKSITANGIYSASDDNADGYSSVTVAVDGFKKKSIAITPTDIASFADGTANPMPSLEISIEPVQSGSGDPSPSNVRPISGWSGAKIADDAKYGGFINWNQKVNKDNFRSSSDTDVTLTDNGDGTLTVDILNTISTRKEVFLTPNSGAYYFKIPVNHVYAMLDTKIISDVNYRNGYNGTAVPTNSILKQLTSSNGNILLGVELLANMQPQTFTIQPIIIDLTQLFGSTVADYIYSLEQATAGAGVAYFRNLFPHDYYPYNAGEITTVSAVNGDVDKYSITSIPFHDNSDNPITVYGGTLNVTSGELRATLANIASYNGETINEPWISSMDAYSAGTTPTTGAQVVYPLTTPQTYQLTPAQVSTLLGQNNIFADCGQILQGEYFVTL